MARYGRKAATETHTAATILRCPRTAEESAPAMAIAAVATAVIANAIWTSPKKLLVSGHVAPTGPFETGSRGKTAFQSNVKRPIATVARSPPFAIRKAAQGLISSPGNDKTIPAARATRAGAMYSKFAIHNSHSSRCQPRNRTPPMSCSTRTICPAR